MKKNHTIATMKLTENSLNLIISIPRSKLSDERTRDLIIDAIKTVDDIFCHNALYTDLDLDSTIAVGGNAHNVELDNVNETKIKKCNNTNNVYLGDHVTKNNFPI